MWELIFAFVILILILWVSHSKSQSSKIDFVNLAASNNEMVLEDNYLPMSYPEAGVQLVNLGYTVEEIQANKQVIDANLETINKLNAESSEIKKSNPNSNPPRFGVSTTTMFTPEEFFSKNLGLVLNPNYENMFTGVQSFQVDTSLIKKSVNLSTDNRLPIYNQNTCGCCWAVSASTVLNYYLYKKYPNTKSNQVLPITNPLTYISCLKSDPSLRFTSQGCRGGDPMDVFMYTQQEGALYEYPDTRSNLTCPFPNMGRIPPPRGFNCQPSQVCDFINQNSNSGASATTQKKLPIRVISQPFVARGNTQIVKEPQLSQIKQHLSTKGPLVVCIDATDQSFMYYKGGVLDNQVLKVNSQPDHAVVLVGYDLDKNNREYWIIQNSWDKSWGLNGLVNSYIDSTGIAYAIGIELA